MPREMSEDPPAFAEPGNLPTVPSISRTDFECLVRRAALVLTQAQMDEMYQAFAVVEAMAVRVRTTKRIQPEPAITFSAKQSSNR